MLFIDGGEVGGEFEDLDGWGLKDRPGGCFLCFTVKNQSV